VPYLSSGCAELVWARCFFASETREVGRVSGVEGEEEGRVSSAGEMRRFGFYDGFPGPGGWGWRGFALAQVLGECYRSDGFCRRGGRASGAAAHSEGIGIAE